MHDIELEQADNLTKWPDTFYRKKKTSRNNYFSSKPFAREGDLTFAAKAVNKAQTSGFQYIARSYQKVGKASRSSHCEWTGH